MYTINWRQRTLSAFDLSVSSLLASPHSFNDSSAIQEPINLAETFHPHVFLVEDRKKLHLCTSDARLLYENLDAKMRAPSLSVKSVTAFCGGRAASPNRRTSRSIYVADSSSFIYELDLDWLTDFKLDALIAEKCLVTSSTSSSSDQQAVK